MPLTLPPADKLRREFGPIPFWFWNDDLTQDELLRQIDDFQRHGVHGFVIHPRVGLPREVVWMSDVWLDFVEFAVEEAARRAMSVVLYDEAMYPSGSSCGQVVASDPALQCRRLARMPGTRAGAPDLPDGWNLVTLFEAPDQEVVAAVDRPTDARIRGVHYIDGGPSADSGRSPQEEAPLFADLLNPRAVQRFVQLVHERYAARLGGHFGKTVIGIFTDEPGPLGRCREKDV